MTLYEADLDKIAVPVKSVEERKEERKRKLKEPKEPKEKKEKKPRKVKDAPITPEPTPAVTPEPSKPESEPEIKVEQKDTLTEPVPEEPKKKRAPRQKKDPSIPPQWFAKYVEGVKKEQAELKEKKVGTKRIKAEAKEAATKSWNNGLTRNRVQNEVDSHMSRMYSMIFSK